MTTLAWFNFIVLSAVVSTYVVQVTRLLIQIQELEDKVDDYILFRTAYDVREEDCNEGN